MNSSSSCYMSTMTLNFDLIVLQNILKIDASSLKRITFNSLFYGNNWNHTICSWKSLNLCTDLKHNISRGKIFRGHLRSILRNFILIYFQHFLQIRETAFIKQMVINLFQCFHDEQSTNMFQLKFTVFVLRFLSWLANIL